MADELIATTLQRKFKLTVFVFLTTTLVLILGHIDQDVWKAVVQWMFAIYIGGNVGQKYITRNGNKNDSSV